MLEAVTSEKKDLLFIPSSSRNRVTKTSKMAFRIMRLKRQARWSNRLQEIFMDWDKDLSGGITVDQMREIFRIYKLTFEDEDIAHLLDPETGEINKDNFVAYSLERKLLDAQVLNFKCEPLNLPLKKETSARRKKMKKENSDINRRERMLRRQASFVQPPPDSQTAGSTCDSQSLFCCVKPVDRDISPPTSPFREVQAASEEKIISAFKKFDQNGDGVIDWDEFQQVSTTVDQEQLRRIFELCDINGDNMITLEEFQFTAGLIKNVPRCESKLSLT